MGKFPQFPQIGPGVSVLGFNGAGVVDLLENRKCTTLGLKTGVSKCFSTKFSIDVGDFQGHTSGSHPPRHEIDPLKGGFFMSRRRVKRGKEKRKKEGRVCEKKEEGECVKRKEGI